MPTNLPKEYFLIEEDYRKARNLDEKAELLKKLISSVPKHKGTEHLLADLRKKLSKLKDEMEIRSRKSASKQETIKKSGDILVSIIGFTQSGKSTFLKAFTRASVEVDSKPYTTKEPATGVCFFEGVNIQFVEIPSFFLKKHMSIAHSSDIVLLMHRNQADLEGLEAILGANKLGDRKILALANLDFQNSAENRSELLERIIEESNIVRVFTKPIGKNIGKKAIVLKVGSVVRDLVEKINTTWLKSFKFARIFDKTKFSGRRVGFGYILKDNDIVEIHTAA